MLNPLWRHRLRRTRFMLGGTLAVLAIVLAVLMALGQLLLPLAAHYPGRVASMLSARLQQPVSFASMDGYWQPSGPLLVLHQVRIGNRNGAPALELPSAQVKLDFGALLWPSRHWVNLRLSGLKLELARDAAGAWHVAGFGAAGKPAAHVSLDSLPGNLWLDDLQLEITDARSQRHYSVRVGPLRLSNNGSTLRFAGVVRRGKADQALNVVGRVGTDGSRGRIYLAGDDVDLGAMFGDVAAAGYALQSGHGDFELWLRWRDRHLIGSTARLDLSQLALTGPAGAVSVPSLQGLLQVRRGAKGMHVLYAGATRGAARVDVVGNGPAGTQVEARLHDLDLDALLPLVSLLPQIPASLARWLATAHPHGHLARAHLRWSHARGIEALAAHFDHLGFDAVGKRPGMQQLHGVLRGDAEALAVELPQQPLTLDFPHTFAKPLVFSSVAGSVAAWRGDDAWHIGSDALDFESPGLHGQLRGSVALPNAGGKPFLDLYATLAHVPIDTAKQFLPVGAISRNTLQWLDRALLAGSLDNAAVVLRGSAADWPFLAHQGRFEARAAISGLALDYGAQWPHAEGISLVASFVDNGMLAQVSAGQSLGVKVHKAVAAIPDFHRPELLLTAQGEGTGAHLLDLVRHSPIGASHVDALKDLKLGGQGDFGFSMVLPLAHDDPTPFTLAGNVDLHDADLDNADWQLQLGKLNGTLAFDNHGFHAKGLTATFRGEPATLDMAVGPATGDPARPLTAEMHGNFSMAQLIQGHDELASLASIASGSAHFDIGFDIDTDAADPATTTQTLHVDSDLRGIALDLPAPLHKSTDTTLPLHMQLGLPFAGNRLQLALGDVLRARARMPAGTRPLAADIMLGGAAAAAPMPAQGVRIGGHVGVLDVSGWARRALATSGGPGNGVLAGVDVTADNAELFGEPFHDLRVQVQPSAQQVALKIDGAQIKGSLTVPTSDIDKRGIVARFDRLYWPSAAHTASASAPAGAASTSAPSSAAVTAGSSNAAVGVAPSALPPLHLWVGDLRFGSGHLGQARFESWPTAQGMHIDQLRTQSKSVHIAASGDWNGSAAASHTHLLIDFSAKNLGRMLDAFGFDGIFTGGETHAHLDATWPGAPSSFALADVEGSLSVNIGKGRIPEVKPGVGRLFGLMSVAELPRRLSLDFGDVFGKGFGFDSIKGKFTLHDGNARTDGLAIKGASANITISGRTGLRAHDYDQQVLVIPHIGNSLPIVGAVVAGPVGAAAGLAVQGLLGKGLNKAVSARYHIGGSWTKPKITLVEKHVPPAAKPATAASAPAPATSAPAAATSR